MASAELAQGFRVVGLFYLRELSRRSIHADTILREVSYPDIAKY